MKKIIASTISVLSLIAPVAASAAPVDVVAHEAKLHIVARLDAGTLVKDIERSQTSWGTVNQMAVFANTREMRMFKAQYLCKSGKDASQCKSVNKALQTY